MALRYSYDPLTSKLDVSFDASEEQRNTPPPNVTPEKAKTVPKPSPQGGSAPSPQKPVIPEGGLKPYYRFGEEVPAGIKTKLETVDIDGKRKAVRVPILPDLTPEQQARVEEAANSQRFATGYDPKSGEFLAGVVPTGMDKPLVEDKAAFDKRESTPVPTQFTKPEGVISGAVAGYERARLRRQKAKIGIQLIESELTGDKEKTAFLRKRAVETEDELNRLYEQQGNLSVFDPMYNFVTTGSIDSLGKAFTNISSTVAESFAQNAEETGAGAGAGAAAGSWFGPPGAALGGSIGALVGRFTGSSLIYTGENAVNQYINQRKYLEETFGDTVGTFPLDSIKDTDARRAIENGIGAAAIDSIVDLFALGIGSKLIKPLKPINKPLGYLKKATPILEAALVGGATEYGQDFLNYLGSNQGTTALDIQTNKELQDTLDNSFLEGLAMGGGLVATGIVAKGTSDFSSAIYNKIKGRKVEPKVLTPEGNLETVETPEVADGKPTPKGSPTATGLNNLDTSDLEIEVEQEPTPVSPEKPKKGKGKGKPKTEQLTIEPTPVVTEKPNEDGKAIKKTVTLYRGTEKGRSPAEVGGTVGGLYFSPDKNYASLYAEENGNVLEKSFTFNNLLEGDNFDEVKRKLGLTPSATQQDVVNKGKELGYDGITFMAKNGRDPTTKEFRYVPEYLVLDNTLIKSAVDTWNEYFTERVNNFEKSQETVRPPSEIYRAGQELGLPVGDIYTKIVGDETTPIDADVPAVKVANNVIKGVVEAAEAQKFYTDLGTNPEAQELYLDAIADSKNNPERQAKIERVKSAVPSVPEVVLDTLPSKELDAIAEKVPEPIVTQEVEQAVVDTVEDVITPVITPPPVAEVTEAVNALAEVNSDPVEQVKALEKPPEVTPTPATPSSLAYNEADDPLAIPAFLDRRKDPRPLLSSQEPVPADTLVGVNYTPVFMENTPQAVKDVIQPYLDNLRDIARQIGRETVGKSLEKKVDTSLVGEVVPIYADGEGGTVRTRAEGEYNPKTNSIYLTVASIVDQLWQTGKVPLEATQNFLTTAVHEFDHAAYMNDYFGNERTDRVFVKSIKDMKDWLVKNTEYGDIVSNYDPNGTKEDRAEIIAYYKQNYIERSSSKAASDFRKAFGIPKSDAKGTFMEPQGGMKLWIQKSLDVFRRIYENLRAALSGLRGVNKEMDKFFTGEFARQADTAYLNSLQRQADALYKGAARNQALFAIKGATSRQTHPNKNPLKEAVEQVKRQARMTPSSEDDYRAYMRDPDNTYGYANKLDTWFSWWRGKVAMARLDGDDAFNLNLSKAVERAKVEYLKAFGPLIEWMRSTPKHQEYMQIMLDLRKQDINLDELNEDGSVTYTNRKGKRAKLPSQHVEVIKEFTKAFSVPMVAMQEQSRANLGHLNQARPDFDIPVDGTVADLNAWLDEQTKTLKDRKVKDKEDWKYLDNAKALIDLISQIDSYISGGKAYVPELRKGSWAIEVKDEGGNQIGLYAIEPNGGFLNYEKPNNDTITKARVEILGRYRGRTVSVSDAFELTRNQLAKDANAGKADLHLLMSLIGQQMQGMLSSEFKAKGVDSVTLADMVSKGSKSVVESLQSASTARGFKARFLKSRHIDGASEDWPWVMDTFFSSAAASLAHMQYMPIIDKTRSAYKEAAASNSPTGAKAQRQLADLDYAMNPSHDAPWVRSFSYMWGLAYRFSTALIQTTPLFNNVPADMISLGIPAHRAYGSLKGAVRYVGSFLGKNNYQNYLQAKSAFTPEVIDSLVKYYGNDEKTKAYVKDAIAKDTIYLNAALVEEALGDVRSELRLARSGSIKKTWDKVQRAGGFMMNTMERASRTGAYMAYMKWFYGNPGRIKIALDQLNKEPGFREHRRFNPDMDDVRAITTYSIDLTFGSPDKAARPRYTRGGTGAVVSPFMGIPSQMWEKSIQDLWGIRGMPGIKGALVGMGTSMLMFGARAGIPTYFFIAPMLLELFGEPDEPGEDQLKQIIVDYLGVGAIADALGVSKKKVLDTVMGGMTYAVAGVDVSARVGNAMPFSSLVAETMPRALRGELPTIDDLTGILGTTASGIPNAIGQYTSGRLDALEAAAIVAPAAIRDVIKAGNMAFGDTIKTAAGKPLVNTDDLTTGDIIAQALGFAPKKIQDAQLRNRAVTMATSFKYGEKTRFKNKFVDLGVRIAKETDPSVKYELKREYLNLRTQFLEVVKETKKNDPDRYDAFFGGRKVKQFFADIDKAIEFELNPKSEEGLSENAKIKLRNRREYSE